ncbi:hypothetical protein KBC55_04095 [Patescibacteria group bacterium]|nr:hypothetical protein [Patescibacteria group bacterium]
MLKFDLIPGGRHDVPPDEDKTDPKFTPKLGRERQIRMLLHPWPGVEGLFLARIREHVANKRYVDHRMALWYAQAIGRMLDVLCAPDISGEQLRDGLARPYDWAPQVIRQELSFDTWLTVTFKIFTYVSILRPVRQDESDEGVAMFILLLNEVFALTCLGAKQLERVKRLDKLRTEFPEVSFLSSDFAERVGWR